MGRVKNLVFAFAVIMGAVALTLMIGCEGKEGPPGPTGMLPANVSGWISANTTPVNTSDVDVWIMGPSVIPTTKITVGTSTTDISIPYGGGSFPWDFWRYDVAIAQEDSVHLRIDFEKPGGGAGVALAHIAVPGAFGITSPDPNLTYHLPAMGSLTPAWTPSNKAQYYEIDLNITIHYVNNATNYTYYTDVDTAITGTAINIPASLIFPPNWVYQGVPTANGTFSVRPMCGPMDEGDPGNVTGDAIGAVWGAGLSKYFTIQMP